MWTHRHSQAWSSQASEGFAVLRLKVAVRNFSFTCDNWLPNLWLGEPKPVHSSLHQSLDFGFHQGLFCCPLLISCSSYCLSAAAGAALPWWPDRNAQIAKIIHFPSVTNTIMANQTARTSWQTKGSVKAEKELNDVLKYYLRLHSLYSHFFQSNQRKHQGRRSLQAEMMTAFACKLVYVYLFFPQI